MKIMLYKLKNISPDIINVAGRLIHPKQEVKTATIEPYRTMLEKGLLKIISEEQNGSPHNILFVHSKRKGEVFSKPFMKMNYEVNRELTERLNRQSAVHNNTSINNPNYIPNLSEYNNIIKIPEANTFMPIDIKSGISYFAPQTNITLSNEIEYVDNFTVNNINDDINISTISATDNISVSNSVDINDIYITTSNDTTNSSKTSSSDFISINTYDILAKDDYILFNPPYATNDSEIVLFNDSSSISNTNILSTADANITNIQSPNISDKSIDTISDNMHQHNTDLLTADVINTNRSTVEDNLLTDVQNEPTTISSITSTDNNSVIQHSNNLIQHFNQLQKEIHQQLNASDTISHENNNLDIDTNNDNDYAINTNIVNNAHNIIKSIKNNGKNNDNNDEQNILMQLINNTADDVNRLMQITTKDTPAYQFIDMLIHDYSNNNADNIIVDNSKLNMDLFNNPSVANNEVYTNSVYTTNLVNNDLIGYNTVNHIDTAANNQLEEIIMQKLDNLLEQKLNQNITATVNQYLIPTTNKCNENTLSIDKTTINNIIQSLFKLFIDRQITDTDLDNIKQFYQRIHILDNIDKSILNQIQFAHSYEELITILLNSVYPALLTADLQSSI